MDIAEKKLVKSWVVLAALTLISLEAAALVGPVVMVVAVLLIAFVKVRIVVVHFMEVGHAPLVLRGILDGWIVVVCVALIALTLWPINVQQ